MFPKITLYRLIVLFLLPFPCVVSSTTHACSLRSAVGDKKVNNLTMMMESAPDPLRMNDGSEVTSVTVWRTQRRKELLDLFTREMYGQSPGRPRKMTFHVFDIDSNALGGLATRKQITISFTGEPTGPHMDLLIYTPNRVKGPVPTILGLNFWGNHAIHSDPGIRISSRWMESGDNNPYVDLSGVKDHRATEACRGINASQWPVERILARGYAVATAYRGDLDPDTADGYKDSVRALYPQLHARGDNFSTIAAWAWGLSRAMDYLTTDRRIAAKHVAVFGWSRLGKAALWAGATDPRFAMVISNESGAGGAKLFRRGVGENIRRLNTVFPHWYCSNFRKYNDLDTTLPFDQHMMLALIAPRPLYIASAAQDTGADPEGEFEAARAVEPVYRLFGVTGLPTETWPPVNHSVQGGIGYHVRSGRHDVTDFDWTQYLAFADTHLAPRRPQPRSSEP